MIRQRLALALVFALGAFAPTVHAQTDVQSESDVRVAPGSFEIGVNMGGYLFLDSEPGLKDTFAYSLAVNANFTRHFGAQLAFDMAPREVNQISFYQLHVDFVVHPFVHEWLVPFIGFGPSFAMAVPAEGSRDSDPGLNVLAGVDIYPFDNIGFRLNARYLARLGTTIDDSTAHDLIASFGLVVTFGGEKEEVPVLLDTDGDGILDNDDACPTVPGVPSAQGCPDADGDTLADDKDGCPREAGPVELGGCPDGDGDKIVDKDDRCPKTPGAAEHKGCPDTDGDTIADLDDRCPKIPGDKQYQGCPPPPPKEVVEKFSGAIEGITFEYNQAVIRPESFPVLDDAVAVLLKYPQLNVFVEGHTSSEGERAHNLSLSQGRADAVRDYLLSKEIDADRIQAQGFGPDRPVADNTTEAGRKQNRRIEFKLLRQ